MPAPEHIRITYFGLLGGGAEIFSFGVSAGIGSAGTTSPFITKDSLQAAVPDLWSPVGALTPGMTTQVNLRGIKVSYVGDNGKVKVGPDGAYLQGEGAYDIAGLGTDRVPLQIALAASLQSAADGQTGRGRFFLPCPIIGALDLDGRLSVAVRDAHSARVKNFVDQLNSGLALHNFGRVSVASGGSMLKGIQPAIRPVLSTRVGRVLDTQTRRRGDLAEDYLSQPVA